MLTPGSFATFYGGIRSVLDNEYHDSLENEVSSNIGFRKQKTNQTFYLFFMKSLNLTGCCFFKTVLDMSGLNS